MVKRPQANLLTFGCAHDVRSAGPQLFSPPAGVESRERLVKLIARFEFLQQTLCEELARKAFGAKRTGQAVVYHSARRMIQAFYKEV